MRSIYSKLVMYIGALSIATVMVPGALAQCSVPARLAKPSSWNPQRGQAHFQRVAQGPEGRDEFEPSIVGLWHVVFTSLTGPPVPQPFDNSLVVWHSDGTEIMNSSRPAQDGNFCLGVWIQTGPRSYYLNHLPWQGNDTSGGASGIGVPQDGAQLTEQVILSPDGNSYSGSFKLVAYTGGQAVATFTGTMKATRVTVSTAFGNLL